MKWFFLILVTFNTILADTTIEPEISKSKPQAIDGIWDSGWSEVKKISKVDRKGFSKPIRIRSMIHLNVIYFLFEWDDESLSDQHKPWIWNNEIKQYVVGDKREDRFVIRWAVSNDSEKTNKANDVWYWGSVRTAQGRADDRVEILSKNPAAGSLMRKDQDGVNYFLKSQGDVGKRSWAVTYDKKAFWLDKSRYRSDIKVGDVNEQNKGNLPATSREDISAVGVWKEGVWTLEVGRRLSTGNFDDIELNWGAEYFFDLSKELYEDSYIPHNFSILEDEPKSSLQFPLKLKMPLKPVQKDSSENLEKPRDEKN